MRDEIRISGSRGEVYLRTTAPGCVVASWYPRREEDPGWPGGIVVATEQASFPDDAWRAKDEVALRRWIEATWPTWLDDPPREPLNPREAMIARRTEARNKPPADDEEDVELP